MAINEVFPNPTLKQVIFQIRFPNLFYIENKIGDLQLKIMEEFPESSLVFQRKLMLVDLGADKKLSDTQIDLDQEAVKKVWQFRSGRGIQLNVLSDSLDINSEAHKTYNLDRGDKFRDIIKFVLDRFFEVTSIPIITRIGLRYVDECPIPSKDSETFKSHYNSAFPLERFNIADAREMAFRTKIKKGDYYLGYIESLKEVGDEYKLILDFDAIAGNIDPENYLQVTDRLHEMVSEEYARTIKEPVYEYMRQRTEGD
jgi:uncharacterized protein (TIGR04255 family)